MDHIIPNKNTMSVEEVHNPLKTNWVLWGHLPHDIDWSIKSYKKIYTMTTVEETICITESLPPILVQNCMLFLVMEGIEPRYEDKQNVNGGYFSYKIPNLNVYEVWKDLTYALLGQTASTNTKFMDGINGISISPKKNFCILKIWMRDCSLQNPALLNVVIKGLSPTGCLFTKWPSITTTTTQKPIRQYK
jgi:hypothetical protein